MKAHIICLAKHFLKEEGSNNFIPIEGSCPLCNVKMLWGDLIRKLNGCYEGLSQQMNEDCDDDDNHWTNALSQRT